jgi:hypothetical protein
MRPARPMPGLNLGQVCVGPDKDGRRVFPFANATGPHVSDTDVTVRCWRVDACTRRAAEIRNGIRADAEAQALVAD